MATRRTRKSTPKVSPLRGMQVEDWIRARATDWQLDVAQRLLPLMRAAAPDGGVVIKWGQPVLECGGPVAYLKVAKAHVTLGFWRGAELDDPASPLEGGDVMKHVKLRSGDELDEKRLAALLRRAVALNRKHGDPTRAT